MYFRQEKTLLKICYTNIYVYVCMDIHFKNVCKHLLCVSLLTHTNLLLDMQVDT